MSRSFKSIPKGGHSCAESDKSDKQKANRKFRRIVKQYLDDINYLEEKSLPILQEVSNPWSFAKDGKTYYHVKDTELLNKLMRK